MQNMIKHDQSVSKNISRLVFSAKKDTKRHPERGDAEFCRQQKQEKHAFLLEQQSSPTFTHFLFSFLVHPSFIVFYSRTCTARRLQDPCGSQGTNGKRGFRLVSISFSCHCFTPAEHRKRRGRRTRNAAAVILNRQRVGKANAFFFFFLFSLLVVCFPFTWFSFSFIFIFGCFTLE